MENIFFLKKKKKHSYYPLEYLQVVYKSDPNHINIASKRKGTATLKTCASQMQVLIKTCIMPQTQNRLKNKKVIDVYIIVDN